MFEIVGFQERRPFHAGKLGALVRMNQHLSLRLVSPDSHQHGLQNKVSRLTALHTPADDAPGVEIDHDRQISEALARPDIGDVGDRGPVPRVHIELPVQRVVDNR